tara:strand:- start:3310 stop:3948 length:639 start_codon:yes stop_codon:yes gene_type:complete
MTKETVFFKENFLSLIVKVLSQNIFNQVIGEYDENTETFIHGPGNFAKFMEYTFATNDTPLSCKDSQIGRRVVRLLNVSIVDLPDFFDDEDESDFCNKKILLKLIIQKYIELLENVPNLPQNPWKSIDILNNENVKSIIIDSIEKLVIFLDQELDIIVKIQDSNPTIDDLPSTPIGNNITTLSYQAYPNSLLGRSMGGPGTQDQPNIRRFSV